MEILLAQSIASVLYGILCVHLLVYRKNFDKYLVLAVLLSLFWNLQGVHNNWLASSVQYYINPYSSLLMYFAWLLYLQASYLSIPGITRTRRVLVGLVNLGLLGGFIFQYRVESILGDDVSVPATFHLSLLIISIAMLFYLENIVRFLKSDMRFQCKHQFFILGIFSFLLFLHSYLPLISDGDYRQLTLVMIFMHVLIPIFVFVSSNRNAAYTRVLFDKMEKEKETQYLMIFIGSGLFMVGTLETFRLFINDFKYDSLNAIFSTFLIGLLGGFVLSNGFRSILVSAFRSYFYRDKNDYKLEWEKINSIVNTDKNIYSQILSYYVKWADCEQGALLLCDRKNKLSQVAIYPEGDECDLPTSFELSEDMSEDMVDQRSNVFWARDQHNSRPTLNVHLVIDDILIAICRLQRHRSMEEIDDASISLCETASTAFAIRLRDIHQKEQIIRQEKMIGFNKIVAFLAHDLKNIAAQQQLAMENFPGNRHDPEFLDDFSGTMTHSTSRLISLVDQFNTSSHYREQDRKLTSLEAVLKDIRNLASKMGTQIDISADIDSARYRVDSRLLSITTNLVKNALEASSIDNFISINMSIDSLILKITVTDHGKGMTRDFINNHLFEPFVTRKKEKGLGIGMFQVQEVITELDGEIEVESEVDQGTTVVVKLPIQEID